DLFDQPRTARLDLTGLRVTVVFWPAQDGVRDPHPKVPKAGFGDGLLEQVPGTSHERASTVHFVPARGFAHNHQVRLLVAVTIDDGTLVDGATHAVSERRADINPPRQDHALHPHPSATGRAHSELPPSRPPPVFLSV